MLRLRLFLTATALSCADLTCRPCFDVSCFRVRRRNRQKGFHQVRESQHLLQFEFLVKLLGCRRKVYSILSLQVLFTTSMCALFMLVLPLRDWVLSHTWIIWIALALSIFTIIAMVKWKMEYPRNIVCLGNTTFMSALHSVRFYSVLRHYTKIHAHRLPPSFPRISLSSSSALFTIFQSYQSPAQPVMPSVTM